MFPKTGVVFLLAVLQFGAVLSFPKISPDPKQKPTISFNKYTYHAVQEVHLNCSDAEKWEPIVIENGNPAYPQAKVTNKTSGKAPKLGLVIKYDLKHMIKTLKVTCKRSIFDDTVYVEQLFATANVKILSANQSVNGGQRVKLECIADGNPAPEYQWYNRTKNGVYEKLTNGHKAIVELITPRGFNTTSIYQCRARNTLNSPSSLWLNSTAVTSVNSTYMRSHAYKYLLPTSLKNHQ